jgi:hypothetical protein
MHFPDYRNLPVLKLLSAIEVASGERGSNTDKLIAKFSHKETDILERWQAGDSEESR